MVFSNNVFVFFFLPFVLLVYYALLRRRSDRNLFPHHRQPDLYAWGEPLVRIRHADVDRVQLAVRRCKSTSTARPARRSPGWWFR